MTIDYAQARENMVEQQVRPWEVLDPRVLMVGLFQHPFYPFTGEVPLGPNMVNVPVPAYTRGMDVRELIDMSYRRIHLRDAEALRLIARGF